MTAPASCGVIVLCTAVSEPTPYIVVINNAVESGMGVYTLGLVRALRAGGHAVTLLETKNDILSKPLAGSGVRFVHERLPEAGGAWSLYQRWSAVLRT